MAFLGVKIPIELSQLLSNINIDGDKEPTNELHITFLMLDTDELDVKDIGNIIEATNNVLKEIEPFFISFNTIEQFPESENKYPTIITIESKQFQKIHSNLFKEFNKADIDFSKKFKTFRPHITLSYSEKKIKKQKIPTLGFTVCEFTLWAGGRGEGGIMTTFPLKIKSLAQNNILEMIKMAEKLEWII